MGSNILLNPEKLDAIKNLQNEIKKDLESRRSSEAEVLLSEMNFGKSKHDKLQGSISQISFELDAVNIKSPINNPRPVPKDLQ